MGNRSSIIHGPPAPHPRNVGKQRLAERSGPFLPVSLETVEVRITNEQGNINVGLLTDSVFDK